MAFTKLFSTTQRQATFPATLKKGLTYNHMPEGTVMSIGFTIEGQGFLALNGGPIFNFGGAISSRSTAMTKKKSVIAGKNYPQAGKKMHNNVNG